MKNEVKVEEKEKKDYSKLILWIVFGITAFLVVLVFANHMLWKSRIEDKMQRIVFYENNELYYIYKDNKVVLNEIYDMDGKKIEEFKLGANEVTKVYCDKGNYCLYLGTSFFDKYIYDNNYYILVGLLLVLVLEVSFIFNQYKIKKIFRIISTTTLVVVGIIMLSIQIYKIFDYYSLVNNTDRLVNASIIASYQDSDTGKRFVPFMQYNIKNNEYYYLADTSIKGTIDTKKGEKVTLYYDKKDNNLATMKKNPFDILAIAYGIIIIVESVLFTDIKLKKKEQK